LNSDTTEIEVLTEYIDPPEASIVEHTMKSSSLPDEDISWGAMRIGRGKAFDLGEPANADSHILVRRQYVTIQGRQILIEGVPIMRIQSYLSSLPLQSSAATRLPAMASKTLALPKTPLAQAKAKPMKLASSSPSKKGFVLDYVELNTDQTNFNFQGDTTYVVSGEYNFSGTTTIEGGTVIKYNENACSINILGTLNCLTAAYRPAIFTSTGDNTVGEAVPDAPCIGSLDVLVIDHYDEDLVVYIYDDFGNTFVNGSTVSSGSENDFFFDAGLGQHYTFVAYDEDRDEYYLDFWPTLGLDTIQVWLDGSMSYSEFGNSLCTPPSGTTVALSLANGGVVHDVHIGNVGVGISSYGDYSVTNVQFVNCDTAFDTESASLFAGNVLMSGVGTGFYGQYFQATAENVTFDQGTNVTADPDGSDMTSTVTLVNALLTAVGSYGVVSVSTSHVETFSSSSGVFQKVGAASYYLANSSTNRGAGTASINSSLLADLQTKTTYPPIVYSNTPISTATNLSPQAFRDTNSSPDLGYHYDPLDYVFGGCDLFTNLTLTADTATAYFEGYGGVSSYGQPYGLSLNHGANFTSTGTATAPCWFVNDNMVMDRANGNWTTRGWMSGMMINGSGSGTTPQLNADFTKFVSLSGNVGPCRDNWAAGVGYLKNCEFYNAGMLSMCPSYYYTNCLFMRSGADFYAQVNAASLTYQNCTFYGGFLVCCRYGGQASSFWMIRDTTFDGGIAPYFSDNLNGNSSYTAFDHNAFLTNSTLLEVVGPTDQTNIVSFNWQSSWFGTFYLPPDSPLIDAGSTTADQVGLYHFTTQTNQVPETNSIVDIGYHYVATDAYGNPLDSNGDGIPDYLEDANGDGLVDDGETNWALTILVQPTSQTTVQGANATFSVVADGIAPLNYQWYLDNTNPIAGATNSSYTVLVAQPVETNNTYSVVVSNAFGGITSSNAGLVVIVPPLITQQPTNTTVYQGSNATFVLIATGTAPLNYQWYFNSATLVNATNSTLTITNVQPPNAGDYSVVVTNAAGSSTSAVASLTVTVVDTNFFNPSGLTTNFDAVYTNATLRLTQPLYYQVGSVFLATSIPLANNASFSTYFAFRLDHSGGGENGGADNHIGADGIVFVVQTLTNNVGGDGGGIGYAGITNSIGIEFDTWFNDGDPYIDPYWTNAENVVSGDGNHVGIDFNGFLTNAATIKYGVITNECSAKTVHITDDMNNSNVWYAWVDYNGVASNLEVRLQETNNIRPANPTLAFTNISLLDFLGATGKTNAFVGFTAATGGDYNEQDILTWQFISQYQPIGTNVPTIPSVWFTSPTNTSPANPATFAYGSPTAIRVVATDQGGAITNVQFFHGTNSNATNFLGTAVPSTNNTYALAWTNALPGTNTLVAIATDNNGLSATSAVVYVVTTNLPVLTTVQIISPTNSQLLVTSPLNILLTASASATIGSITNVQFFNGASLLGNAVLTTNNIYLLLWTDVAAGAYSLTAKAADNLGDLVTSAAVAVTVNAMPLISIITPTNLQSFLEVTNVSLSAAASDSDGSITNVQFYAYNLAASNLLGSLTTTNGVGLYNLTWSNLAVGAYPVIAVATDNRGASTVSEIKVFRVTPTNLPPSVAITYPTNNSVFPDCPDITLTAVATNGSGTVTNVEYFVNGQGIGNASDAPYSLNQCCWKPGTYTIVAMATDNLGGSSVSTNVQIIVSTPSPTGVGFWDPTFHTPNVLYTPGPQDECGNYLALVACLSASLYGSDLYLAGIDGVRQDINSSSLYKLTGTNWFRWGGPGAAPCVTGTPFGFGSALDGIDGIGGVAVNDSGIYVAGFDNSYEDTMYAVWQSDGTDWTQLGGHFQTDYYTEYPDDQRNVEIDQPRLQFVGTDLYLFGNFNYGVPDTDTNIQYIAKWNAVSNAWQQVGTPLNGPVWAITSLNGNLVVGGQFTDAGGNTNANLIAELVGGNWENLGNGLGGEDWFVDEDGNPYTNCNCEVLSLATSGTNLFVGGDFTSAGDQTNANSIAIWNGLHWKALGSGLSSQPFFVDGYPEYAYYPGNESTINPIVYTISTHCDAVYVGGVFSDAINPDGTDVQAASVAKATWDEGSQQWSWSGMDVGVCYQSPFFMNFPARVLMSVIQEDQTSGAYDVIIGGDVNVSGQFIGSAPNSFPAISRWRVGYPQPPSLPKVTIVNPATQTIVTNNSPSLTNIIITATASSSYTNLNSVEFYVNGQLLDTVGDGSCSCDNVTNTFTWSTNQNGVYIITAVAVDDDNFQSASSPVLIDIKSTTNSISAADDQFTIPSGSPAVTLQVLNNDIPASGLKISQVATTRNDLGTVAIDPKGAYLTYTPFPNVFGEDVFFYTVTNAAGAIDSASVTVNIVTAPQITSPFDQDRIPAPAAPLIISGTAGAGGNGYIVTNISLLAVSSDGVQATNQTPTSGGFSFNWTNSTPGFYTFVAVASAGGGFTNASAPVTIALYDSNAPAHMITALITNLVATDNSQVNFSGQVDPVITNAIFDLQGQAEDSVGTNPVSYQVLLYQPNSGITAATTNLNLQAAFYDWSPPFANVTPGPLNAQGFHAGGDNNGDLGLLDLTAIPNGVYELVLNVRGGADETNTLVEVQINSQLKIGQFSFSEQDLVLPVSGIPITVTRTYNSLNPLAGDFGCNWSYALNSMNVQLDETRQDVTIGSDQAPFADDDSSPNGLPKVVSIRTGGGWDVTLTLPNGKQAIFAFSMAPGFYSGTATWTPPAWVHATLTPLDPSSATINFLTSPPYWEDPNNPNVEGVNAPIENQDFPGWILTTQPDGTQYYITRGSPNGVTYADPNNPGSYIYARVYGPPMLTQIVQRSGDTIVISANSIYHQDTNGISRTVSFDRDAWGRITAIYDPNGGTNSFPAVQYVYNQDTSNLLQVLKLVDRNAGTYVTNRYDYNNPSFPHFITSIENGDGVPVARNYYDDSGKLIAVQDADGNLTQFIHNLTNNLEVVIDRLGHTNSYVYDLNGNVTAQTNALGQVATMAYDANNNKTNEITYLNGLPYATNSSVYDPTLNLPLITTDPLGHTSTFTYDGYGDLLTSTDARGNTTTNNYDSTTGNLLSSSDALGDTTVNTYSGGLLASSRDAIGTVTANSYDNSDNLIGTATLDASSTILSSNTFTYDNNGNRLNSTVWRHVGASWVGATTTYIYDAKNRVIQTIDPDGGTNTVVYNAIGKQQATIDALGNTTAYAYDDQGRLIQTTYADATTETSAYDAAGNRTNSVDRAGRTTVYVYDALNRLTETIYPDTTTNTTVYDGVGRVAQNIDARGTVTGFAYDAAGRRLAVTNAFGINGIQNVSVYAYDANGNQITFTDANIHTTTNVFDALNRQVQVNYPDGTETMTVYDADGRRVVETNQDNLPTWFGYDGAGRLIAVTNTLDQVTRYQYDEAGNETAQIDALNRTNSFAYDSMGRRIGHFMPGNQSENSGYDFAGNLIYQTNFNGAVITNQYDVMNRLTNCVSVNGYKVSYAYNLTGLRTNMTDVSGVTSYAYDNRDRLQLKTMNWSNGPTVSLYYLYDVNGAVTNIWSSTANGVNLAYGYDPLSRLTNVLANGNVAANYGFDLVGNLQTIRYGNGVTNQYQYDSMNRLTNQVWKLNASTLASFYYQLGLTGNRTNLSESVNGTSRTYAWKYDSLYRLTNENVSALGSVGYGYDTVGNRTNRTSSISGILPTNSSYNPNDWAAGDQYDSNGSTTNSSGNFYRYDVLNHLTNINNTIFITYDGDGNRASKTIGGTTTYYLLDDRNPSGYVQVLEEWTAASGVTNLSKVYNYGLALVSQRQPNVSTNYFVSDGHGSTRMLTDIGGNFVNAFAYDAYGTLIASNGAAPTAYLYCGQQFDPDLGLYFNRARYLNTDTGRFWTRDSTDGDNEDPLSLHKYLYGADNPVNNIDPSGNDFIADVVDIGDMLGSLDSFVVNAQLVLKKAMSVAYRQRAFNLLTTVIRPTLNSIQDESGTKLAGENAEYMLLGTCIAETGDLDTRRQKNGPALGLFQMEPFTHDDLWNNYLSYRPKLRDAVLKHFNITSKPPPNAQLLESNDSYAAIMARIRYLPAPAAMPSSTDLKGQAQYWVTYYNRGGKGTVADYLARWHAAMGL